MDDGLYLDNWMNEDWAMNVDDRDDDDSEQTVLFQQLLDRNQNYYNHLVVFVDSNLIDRQIIDVFFFLFEKNSSQLTSTINIIAFFIERISGEISFTNTTAKTSIMINLKDMVELRINFIKKTTYVIGGHFLFHGINQGSTGKTSRIMTNQLFK